MNTEKLLKYYETEKENLLEGIFVINETWMRDFE
jgi:hypothetical protein